MTITSIKQNKCFGGIQKIESHEAKSTGCTMRFGIFLPPQAETTHVPVLYWLSGLTCTEENFIIKAGAQRMAAQLGIALVVPDTSPRGAGLPGEDEEYDVGEGAGFYVDATVPPWSHHYQMYTYVTDELVSLVHKHYPIDANHAGIFGHSMGGHGALTIALKNPHYYKSVSAFAPICSSTQSVWGEKALSTYLGSDRATWKEYDAVSLIESHGWDGPPILVDQGTEDEFLHTSLKPHLLQEACEKAAVQLTLRMQPGYDHTYFFVATFMEDHLLHHAKTLCK